MKIAVIGSRNFKHLERVNTKFVNMAGMLSESTDPLDDGEVVIISGGAVGVDQEAAKQAYLLGFKYIEVPPDMKKGYDVREYHRRNDKIIELADKVIAFWDGESKGTGSVIEKCLAKRRNIEVVFD